MRAFTITKPTFCLPQMQWQWRKKMQRYFLWKVTGFYASSFTWSKNIFQVLEENTWKRFYAKVGYAFSATHLPNYFTLPSPLSHHIKWTSIPYLYIKHFETLYLYTVWVWEMYGTTLKLNHRRREISSLYYSWFWGNIISCEMCFHCTPLLPTSFSAACRYSVPLRDSLVLALKKTMCHGDMRTGGCRTDPDGNLCLQDANKKKLNK